VHFKAKVVRWGFHCNFVGGNFFHAVSIPDAAHAPGVAIAKGVQGYED
jgi:hypothetical protein